MVSDTTRGNIICRLGCGTRIKFDDKRLSINGKMIPLNFSDNLPHNCPLRNQDDQNFRQNSNSNSNSKPQNSVTSNKDNDNDNVGLSAPTIVDRKAFLEHFSEMIEHHNNQMEQMVINLNQVKNRQNEILQTLMEIARK